MMKSLWLLLLLAAVGCAAQSGIVQTGKDSYLASRQAATGFPGMGNLKAEAIQEAGQYCATKGRVIKVLSTSESAPPYILGNYPRVEVQFSCE